MKGKAALSQIYLALATLILNARSICCLRGLSAGAHVQTSIKYDYYLLSLYADFITCIVWLSDCKPIWIVLNGSVRTQWSFAHLNEGHTLLLLLLLWSWLLLCFVSPQLREVKGHSQCKRWSGQNSLGWSWFPTHLQFMASNIRLFSQQDWTNSTSFFQNERKIS